jgi:release factor glutamine methyltransferase
MQRLCRMSNYNENPAKIWTVSKILAWTESYFKSKGIESPRLGAELLLCSVLKCERVGLYTNFDKPLLKNELELFRSYIKRRADYEPVSYITNEKSFFELDYYINPNVLIPRPDTEKLIETVIELYPSSREEKLKILELGTGSGIIAVSLLKYFKNSTAAALDISIDAVKTAKINAGKNGLSSKIFFFLSRWFSGVSTKIKFDLIVSNPPYIKTSEISSLQPEIRLYEPLLALDGGEDGLLCIKEIIENAHNYLNKNGYLVIEAGCEQKNGIMELTDKNENLTFIEMVKDYGGRDRVAVIKRV